MKNKKRNKIIFGTFVCIIISVAVLFFITHPWHDGKIEETAVVHEEEEVSKEPELSDTRKELERLYEARGTKNHQTSTQTYLLMYSYDYPLFGDLPQEYCFDDQMGLYLEKLNKLAEKEGEYDFLYNAISDSLIWNYNTYKEEMSEEHCERFLTIINLCKKRLETARIWEEPPEEPKEVSNIKLTDTRKELEILHEERGNYSSCSEREVDFLTDNYDIPFLEDEPSENSFEECYNSYLDKMEKLVNPGEWDLLYEAISDYLDRKSVV